jgi:hypothetical protein
MCGTFWRVKDKLDWEAATIRERLRNTSVAAALTKQKYRQTRLRQGGRIHVNVLIANGRIKRYFLTPMIAADGGHVDLTIPLFLGLEYGLEVDRYVDIKFDISRAANHSSPYAPRSLRTVLFDAWA